MKHFLPCCTFWNKAEVTKSIVLSDKVLTQKHFDKYVSLQNCTIHSLFLLFLLKVFNFPYFVEKINNPFCHKNLATLTLDILAQWLEGQPAD